MTTVDPFRLQRFVEAQEPVIDQVLSELRRGKKTGHWMWFVFPQLAGLGSSPMAARFAIGSLAEARAFLRHPLLGERLQACSSMVAAITHRPIEAIFGYPDNLKFHSSMTLFSRAGPECPIFQTCLRRYFDGALDVQTMRLLAAQPLQ